METRKYPIPDEIKERAANALAEMADVYEARASGIGMLNCREGTLRGEEILEKAKAYRQAFEYLLNL